MDRLIIKILLTIAVIISLLSCHDRCGDRLSSAEINNTTLSLITVTLFSGNENKVLEITRESSLPTRFVPELHETLFNIVPDSIIVENSTKTLIYRNEQFGGDLSKKNYFFNPTNWTEYDSCDGIVSGFEYSIRSEDFGN